MNERDTILLSSNKESVPETGVETQIVVLGGGGAGLATAVAAAEKGATVIVLEKRRVFGGNSALARGIFAAESPAQKRAMIDARQDELFMEAMEFHHLNVNPRIVRAFINKSGDTIRWLEEKGVEFDIVPLYMNQFPLTLHCPKGTCASITKTLTNNCKNLGVQMFHRTQGKRIITGTEGNVTGVLAMRGGEEFTINARSVIIATGGYGGNKELLKKYCPYDYDEMYYFGLPHKGDGLIMALEMGAATEGLGILLMAAPAFADMSLLGSVVMEPNTLWVNKKGERFATETASFSHFVCANAVIRQPDQTSYTLFDAKTRQLMSEHGLIIGLGKNKVGQRTSVPELERELQIQANKDRVKISDSWDDIADWIGAGPKILKSTIDEYNDACDRGYDPIFAKDRKYLLPLRTAPYYAIKSHPCFFDTMGGIKINEHMEVIDNRGKPIKGLYAAGVNTGGWESDTYCAALSGSPCGFAINSGRIAGENAARYVSGE